MRKSSLLAVSLLATLLVGCATITNLTPSQLPRNARGLYHFEVAFISQQRALIPDSIRAYVVIGLKSYPLKPTPLVEDRWQGMIPIPADTQRITYRYKIDYEYNSIPQPRPNSRLSEPYQLQIVD